MAAAGTLGLVLALRVVWQGRENLSTIEMLATLIAIPGGFLLAGLLLASSDEIRAAIDANHRVSWPSRALFGKGIWSILLWCLLILVIGLPLAVWVGTQTW